MLVAAAVLPHPPLLVPDVARAAASELARLLAACDRAVTDVLEAGAELVVLVGGGEHAAEHAAGARGSFRGLGVDLDVVLGGHAQEGGGATSAELPLSLTVGAWLLARSGWDGPVAAVSVAPDASAEVAREAGQAVSSGEQRVGLLVMGDGSARMSVSAPGYVDARAERFEGRVAQALAEADTGALLSLDPVLASELLVAGRVPWQVLAGAADHAQQQGRTVAAHLLAHEAPYGVDYLVATWRLEGDG